MSKRSSFQAPRTVTSFEDVAAALREVQEALDTATGTRAKLKLYTSDFPLVAGNFHRVTSQTAAGLKARLPAATGENLADPVYISLEGMLGPLEVWAAPGQTVNGGATATFDVDGIIALWSNGVNAWAGIAQVPAESPAGEALDAEYVLGSAHASLPNGAVATDTSEINVTITPGVTATWALIDGSIGLPRFANVAAGTFLGNVTGSSGPVTANSLSTLAGAGLAYSLGVMAVGAGTRIAVNANDVQLASGAADSFLMNATASPGVADYRAGSSVAGAGLTYTTGGTLAVGAGTHITANANDVAVDVASLLAAIDSTSVVVSSSTLQVAAYTGAISKAQNALTTLFAGIRNNGSATTDRTNLNFINSSTTNAVLVDDAGGDEIEIAFSVAADAITNTLLANMAQSTIKGRPEGAGTGDPTDLTPTQVVAIIDAESPTWTGSHTFAGTGTFFSVNVDNASAIDTASTFALVSGGASTFTFGADSSISTTGSLDILTSTDLTLDADGNVIVLGSGIVQLGDGVIEGYLRMQGSTTSDPSVASNEGMYWVFDPGSAATLPYFTDDANADHELAKEVGVVRTIATLSAIQSATNSTSTVTAVSGTAPGGKWSVGTTYKLEAQGNFTRGATATALNLTFNIALNGTTYATASAAAFTAAGTGAFTVTGQITCLSTGGSGTFIANFSVINEAAQVTTPTAAQVYDVVFGSQNTAAAGTTQNTANNLTLALTGSMSAAVSNCVLRFTNATITKMN